MTESEPARDTPQAILEEHLDEEDYEIFRALNENGRMSDTAIAERVGLSRTAVRRRREKLVDEGVLRILAVIVLQEADLAYAEVGVTLETQASREKRTAFIERLLDEQLIYQVSERMNDHDLFFEAWHTDLGTLKRYIDDLLVDVDIIEDYEISPIIRTYKAWDTVLDRPD